LWNESFFSAPQLKRDPLGTPLTFMGILGFVVGTILGLGCGRVAYRLVTRKPGSDRDVQGRVVAGITTAACASLVYVILDVHEWLLPGSSWGMSVFMGVCMGIVHAVLVRDPSRSSAQKRL
jgi:hypothetical protein